jgi:branched-chain amino acid transport system substrate-binding protein
VGALLVLLGWLLAGCHVFDSIESCSLDADCPLGQRCHPEGHFCELDTGPVRIGATIALSGDLGAAGRDIATALDVAARVVGASGGVLGRPLAFDLRDDETSVARAEENVRALRDARVAAIVGPLTSSQALATQSITFAAQIVQISPTAGALELSSAQPARERYFFRTVSTARAGSAVAIALFARTGPARGKICQRMAILHTDDAIGVAYRDAVSEHFGALGGCVTGTVSYPSTELVSYDEQVTALVAQRPDCATIVAFPEAGVEIIGETKKRIAKDTTHDWSSFFWLGTTSLRSTAFLEASKLHPENPAEGVYGADEDSTPPTREYRELRERYNAELGRAPDEELPIFVSNTYDAALLAALAVEHAGSLADRVAIRDGLWEVSATGPEHQAVGPVDWAEARAVLARGESIHYKGASSQLVFDAFGTVSHFPAVVWKVEGGAIAIIERYTEEQVRALVDDQPGPDAPACP